jgi:predicted dehydrogenase
MNVRFAFAGFRHAHILDVHAAVREREGVEIVACCEEDAATRDALAAKGDVQITHHDFNEMLRTVDCDVIALGDTYGRRGALAIASLRAGKHLLSDKPLCTTLPEWAEIDALATKQKRIVGLQLDSRGAGAFRALREIVRAGEIGNVCTIRIEGQHPLLWGRRPQWYFEPGAHGGTINDIAIHAFDFIPWITGLTWRAVNAARSWNAKAIECPHFHDCAQVMATLENGAGVLADYSYLAPDTLGYKLPHYWHLTIHGTRGMAETYLQAREVSVILDEASAPEMRAALPDLPRRYLDDFLAQVRGETKQIDLTSADCLRAARLALEVQRAADSAPVAQ